MSQSQAPRYADVFLYEDREGNWMARVIDQKGKTRKVMLRMLSDAERENRYDPAVRHTHLLLALQNTASIAHAIEDGSRHAR